jgi:tRNA pseudouridine55 synthase
VTGTDGLLVVDKPAGLTSHDVVGRVRRWAGTRKVGHAGTLDPMATGVLVLGIGRATRLLGHLSGHDKAYDATIRLGLTTTTDDADGDAVRHRDASGVLDAAIVDALRRFTGPIEQVPAAVSAVKVAGERSYARVRRGESVELPSRPVVVHRLDLVARRGEDLDLRVECSAGTYVRAIARDVGEALGVGAHLTALRRTRSGSFDLAGAAALDALDGAVVIPLGTAVEQVFPKLDVSAEVATRLGQGQRIAIGPDVALPPDAAGAQLLGAFGPDGEVIAIVEVRDGAVRPSVVFAAVG